MSCFRGLVLASAAVAVLSLGSAANAGVVYDNLNGTMGAASGGTADISSANHGPLGNSFSTDSGSSLLADVKLLILADTPSDGGHFNVLLMSNNSSNNTPSSVLATLATVNDSSLITSLATVDVPLSTPYLLAANTRYWIELNGNPTSAQWSYTATNLGIGVANEYNFYFGESSANNSFTPYQMQVTTSSAVPEPAGLGLYAIGIAAVAIARRRVRR